MTERRRVRIGDLCSRVTSGGTPSTKHAEYYGGSIPWLRTQEVDFNRITDTEVKITEEGLKNSSAKWIPTNAVIVAMYGATAGRIAIAKVPLTTNQACCNLIVDPQKADYRYVYYALMHNYVELSGRAKGSAQTNLNAGLVKEFEIPDFGLPTQKRIADILSAYDDLIENNRRRMEILEESARLIFKERFEDVWERGKLPRGWRTCCVPDCIEVEPEVANPHCDEIRYIPMAALSTSGMTIDVAKAEMRTKAASVRFANGDVLLAGITPCLENGKTGFVNFLDKNEIACGSTEFIVLRGRTVSPYFTYCLSRTERFRETAIKSMVGASGRQRVQPECFNTYEIALPTTTILREFDELVEPMFEQIGLLVKQNQDLAEARDMLLPKLMTQT